MRRNPSELQPRQGSVTLWTVLTLVVCVGCVSLAANAGYLSLLRAESRRCAQAAAVTAARQLLNDDMLRSNYRSFEAEGRRLNCASEAGAIAGEFRRRYPIPPLKHNDIRFHVRDADPALPMLSYVPSALDVVISNTSADESIRGNLLLGGFAGFSHGRIAETARVILNNRVTGFRAAPRTPIPMVPLAIPDDPDARLSACWTTTIERRQGTDRLSRNSSGDITATGDRIPEIILTIDFDAPGPGRMCAVAPADPFTSAGALMKLIRTGITEADQAAMGTEMVRFPADGTMVKPSTADRTQLMSHLTKLIGEPRIFPLYDAGTRTDKATSGHTGTDRAKSGGDVPSAPKLKLLRPVAARIMSLQAAGDDNVQLVLQPCVMSTPTMVSEITDNVSNPYIWNIRVAD